MFLKSNFDSIIPQMDLSVDDLTLIALVTREIKAYISSLESLRYFVLNCCVISVCVPCELCTGFVMEYGTSSTFLVLVMPTYKQINHGS